MEQSVPPICQNECLYDNTANQSRFIDNTYVPVDNLFRGVHPLDSFTENDNSHNNVNLDNSNQSQNNFQFPPLSSDLSMRSISRNIAVNIFKKEHEDIFNDDHSLADVISYYKNLIISSYPNCETYDIRHVLKIIVSYLNINYDNNLIDIELSDNGIIHKNGYSIVGQGYHIFKETDPSVKIVILTQKERFTLGAAAKAYNTAINRNRSKKTITKDTLNFTEVVVPGFRGAPKTSPEIVLKEATRIGPKLVKNPIDDQLSKINSCECICGSGKHAKYALIGNSRTNCIDCKLDLMVHYNDNKCCCGQKRPRFGFPGKKAEYCRDCKTDQMINVYIQKCLCKKYALYGLIGGKKTHCRDCKTDKMTRIDNTKCINEFCDVSANIKYENYCTHCFRNMFPDDPRIAKMYTHTKEQKVKNFLDKNFANFIHNKAFYTKNCDCSLRRRIDHYVIIKNTCLAIETDENQHRYYDKRDEVDRYNDLYMGFSGMFIYIRFNPDHYIDIYGNKQNPTIKYRFSKLKIEIDQQITRIKENKNTELVEIKYLFYDELIELNYVPLSI